MTSRLPSSLPDTQLGLSPAEIILLRHHQALALPSLHSAPAAPVLTTSSYYASPTYAAPTIASRGRGASRSSAHSSRASSSATSGARSTASAAPAGRLVLEAGSLAVLAGHFERVMNGIGQRIDYLTAQTQNSALAQSSRAASSMAGADAEIARFRGIMQQIDELETEFDKVRNIRDIVAGYRRRVAAVGGRRR